jgi:hypothetical protein
VNEASTMEYVKTTDHPPALPEGWRSADSAPPYDTATVSDWRRRAIGVVVAVALVAGGTLAILLLTAESHYDRGRVALQAGAYATAADEFARARPLGLPFRDAATLEQDARRTLAASAATRRLEAARNDAVLKQLDKAGARLRTGDPDGVLAALKKAEATDLRGVLSASSAARDVAGRLADGIAGATNAALKTRAWHRSDVLLAALLILEPGNTEASSLDKRIRAGQRLSATLAGARAAAKRGNWRTALRLVTAVLAADKSYPGAARLAARARVALAPKPKPSVTAAAPAAPAATTTSSAPSTPQQPPPP